MSDAAATTASAPAEQPAAPASEAPATGVRPPADPEKRARLQRKAAVRRLVGKLADAEDTEGVWKRLEKIAESEGRALKKPGAAEAAPAAGNALAIDPKAVAGWDPSARELWEGVRTVLGAVATGLDSPTCGKFAAAMHVHERETIGPDEQTVKVKVDPIATLAGPTAECAAKWLPKGASGPEARLAGAVAAVFAPVAAALVFEAMGRAIEKKAKAGEEEPAKEEKAEGANVRQLGKAAK